MNSATKPKRKLRRGRHPQRVQLALMGQTLDQYLERPPVLPGAWPGVPMPYFFGFRPILDPEGQQSTHEDGTPIFERLISMPAADIRSGEFRTHDRGKLFRYWWSQDGDLATLTIRS